MFVHVTQPLFAWGALEDSPSLRTIKALLDALPDGQLIESLEQARGRGHDDYPVHVLWGGLVLSVALRHPSIEACLAELERNEGLGRHCAGDATALHARRRHGGSQRLRHLVGRRAPLWRSLGTRSPGACPTGLAGPVPKDRLIPAGALSQRPPNLNIP